LKDAFLIARSLVLRRELRGALNHRIRRWRAAEKWSPCSWYAPRAPREWLRNRVHEQQSVGLARPTIHSPARNAAPTPLMDRPRDGPASPTCPRGRQPSRT
jgi:hypothetical protein